MKLENLKPSYTFNDIFLYPKYNPFISRENVSIQTKLGDLTLEVPIISSNMDTVTGAPMAVAMHKSGAIGALHRFNTIDAEVEDFIVLQTMKAPVFVSIGVTATEKARFLRLLSNGATHFIVDIAHGHSALMKEMVRFMRAASDKIHILAGNVATSEGVRFLEDLGVDGVKVGIGGGSICKTRVVTGHGVPMATCLEDCAGAATKAYIIADGGFKSSGDIVKALALGADAVMLGSLLAGTDETPGNEIVGLDGRRLKVYRGSASKEVYQDAYGEAKKNIAAEGVATTVPCKGPVGDVIRELAGGIKSGLTYSGAPNLTALRASATFGLQTRNGYIEGTPHITNGR